MRVNYTRITSPSAIENIKLRLMIVIAVIYLFFFIRTIFIPYHGGNKLLYISLCITLGYMCLKYLHEWYHYFNITAPPLANDAGNYSVDIFTTYCEGEPLEMLDVTLRAISTISYPHTSWCCDEEDNPAVKELCRKYSINHVTRQNKRDAKAGNINNALKYATGEICVILDPDHIPAPEFLDVVLPYFKKENVGFVQVVQAYYNHHESLVAKGAAQQTYQFYGPMMMCMNSYGTVQALGANCTFRRAALDSIGGHAAGLAEDMHTAMKLHAKGWKSVYVPAVIERGLVPATLSAYYKQQLKWARGTFELLVTVYPRLFRKFTLFQKFHYFLLPFHYFAGLAFLLNFLIPVFSLFLGESPLVLDFTTLLLAAIPLALMIALIRHYVQKWVVEETERGFHIVGGLLQIGTWWVYLTGLIFTVVRKKVPYIPTPKTSSGPIPLSLHFPNIFIIILSIAAIIYGLDYDLTPFSVFMAGLAFINVCVLLFVIYSAYKTNRRFSKGSALVRTKRQLWTLRHWAYKFVRNYALVFSFLVVACSFYVHRLINSDRILDDDLAPSSQTFYKGIALPAGGNTSTMTDEILKQANENLQIVSYNIEWADNSGGFSLPVAEFNKLFKKQMVPLLELQMAANRKCVFDKIVAGNFDSTIHLITSQLLQIDKPVFISFGSKAEHSQATLSLKESCDIQSSIAAWKYLHKKFDEAGCRKVVWVWNTQSTAASQFVFPGQEYVDWLGVRIEDSIKDGSISFENLYRPFHNDSIFKLGLPVMITEVRARSSQKQQWWGYAWEVMEKKFTEIKALITSGVGFDKTGISNNGQNQSSQAIHIDSLFKTAPLSNSFYKIDFEDFPLRPSAIEKSQSLPKNIRAVVYDKGVHWFRNVQTASIKVLEKDIEQMKELGVNTIFRTLPDIYNRNFFQVTQKDSLNVVLQLWADIPVRKIDDDEYMLGEQDRLVQQVKIYQHKKNLIGWNLSNDGLYAIETAVTKPDRFALQSKYIAWLQQLIARIKKIDTHPVFVSVIWNDHAQERIKLYNDFVGTASQFLLNIGRENVKTVPSQLPLKFSWGMVNPVFWNLVNEKNLVVPAWQDQQTSGFVSLDGIIDFKGRKKQNFEKIVEKWDARTSFKKLPSIKVLKPAKLPFEEQVMVYNALVKNSFGNWTFAKDRKDIHFEWYLVQTDAYGNALSIKPVGEGAVFSLKAPSRPELYQLYLEAEIEGDVTTILTPLGLPLEIDAVK